MKMSLELGGSATLHQCSGTEFQDCPAKISMRAGKILTIILACVVAIVFIACGVQSDR
jgi:hypothetical protein